MMPGTSRLAVDQGRRHRRHRFVMGDETADALACQCRRPCSATARRNVGATVYGSNDMLTCRPLPTTVRHGAAHVVIQ